MTGARRLIVMRHAKAGELAGGPDALRELRPRGCREAAAAGRWLAARGLVPDQVICSPARRARQTWEYVSEQLGPGPQVFDDPRLYDADATDLADIIGQTQPEVRTLMYVGHNPAAAELTAMLTGSQPDFPTSAIAVVDVAGEWPALSRDGGTLAASWTPRSAA